MTAYEFRRRRPILQSLTLRLDDVLDDGSGRVRPELVPLRDFLLAVPKPGRILVWLRNNPRAANYLHALAVGKIPLTHDALHDLPSPKTVSHLRDLLISVGVLPAIDRQIALYESWARASSPRQPRPSTRQRSGCCASSTPGTCCPTCTPAPPAAR